MQHRLHWDRVLQAPRSSARSANANAATVTWSLGQGGDRVVESGGFDPYLRSRELMVKQDYAAAFDQMSSELTNLRGRAFFV